MKRLLFPIIFIMFIQHAPAGDPPLYPYPAPEEIILEDNRI